MVYYMYIVCITIEYVHVYLYQPVVNGTGNVEIEYETLLVMTESQRVDLHADERSDDVRSKWKRVRRRHSADRPCQ